jgi:hypothetical protein
VSTALARAALGMAQSLERLAGVDGLYVRGDTESQPLVGVPVQHEYEVIDDETGLPAKVLSYDWRFVAAELLLDGVPITPRKGDRWKPTLEGVEEIYEVLPLGKRPCFERADTSGVLLLVHTKKVGA